jgi:hypothetical protein
VIFSLLDQLLRRILRRALRQGVLEGSFPWLAAGAFALVARMMFKPQSPKVRREELAVGETIVITHHSAPDRRKPRDSST